MVERTSEGLVVVLLFTIMAQVRTSSNFEVVVGCPVGLDLASTFWRLSAPIVAWGQP